MRDWLLIIAGNLVLLIWMFRNDEWKQGTDENWLRLVRATDERARDQGWAFYSFSRKRATWKRGSEFWGIDRNGA